MDHFREQYIKARREVIARNFSQLNDRQRQAVLATEGPLLILAGAGSGKTTVLIHRIANLMRFGSASDSSELPPGADEDKLQIMNRYLAGDLALRKAAEQAAVLRPVSPWQILAITFTNKAADELRTRLMNQLGEAAEGIWARTFHSACARILRTQAHLLGFPDNFTIYDTNDRTSVIKKIIREQKLDEKDFQPRDVLSYIDRQRGKYITPDQAIAREAGDWTGRHRMMAEMYRIYSKKLMEAGAMDFDDLLYYVVKILTDFPEVLAYYQHKFRYILVDEYQDTNHLQYMLVNLLAGGHRNLCVVGDDDQSIYSFRGATIRNILSFEGDYPQARTIRLEQNYRSTGHILDAANAVVAHNTERKSKTLWTNADSGEPIHFFLAETEEDEAQYVVNRVLQSVSEGDSLRDHAVLYRFNAQSRALEQAFLRHGIRPKIVKGNPFFERAEIKDLLSYFFVILNPADDLRLQRIVNVPSRRIGEATLSQASDLAAQTGLPLFTVFSMADRFPELKQPAPRLLAFVRLMNKLSAVSQEGVLALYDAILQETGYESWLREKYRGWEAENKVQNVGELRSYIVSQTQENGDASLGRFLDSVSLYTDLDRMEEDDNTVKLMTVHSAKGLEFPTVFVVGMEDGIFPALQALGEGSKMEEERRLAYVAITRAKRHLYITGARTRTIFGNSEPHKISRFVEEIPPEHLDEASRALFTYPGMGAHSPGGEQVVYTLRQEPGRKPSWQSQQKKPALRRSAKTPVPETAYAVSDRVCHSIFGPGTIVRMTPMGGDHMVEIQLDSGETKKIMLKATRRFLTKLGLDS